MITTIKVYWLSYAVIRMICLTTGRALVLVKGDHMQISFSWRQIFEKLQRMKFLRIEITYDCVVIEGYRTRTKTSYGKLSFR